MEDYSKDTKWLGITTSARDRSDRQAKLDRFRRVYEQTQAPSLGQAIAEIERILQAVRDRNT